MRMVVLDGWTTNPGDLNWDGLRALGECRIWERTTPEETRERASGAEIVLTNKVVLDASTIDALPALRYIGVLATGCNVVDVAAALAQGVVVANVPAYSRASTAQATFALLLELTNQVGALDRSVHAGRWQNSVDFAYWDRPLIELAGLTIGIVGFGSIGQTVARLAQAFEMRILVHTRTRREPPPGLDVEFVGLDDLFARADVVTLHCPLTPDTAKLVNAARLDTMKPAAFVLNTGRGGLIDEAALADALHAGRIAGAGLDVLSVEPPRDGSPLLTAPNAVITPHVAWATHAARARLLDTATKNVAAFLSGEPINVVG